MITRSQKAPATRGPIIQLYNDRLAATFACDPANRKIKNLSFAALREFFSQSDDNIEDYLDLLAERALPINSSFSSTKRVVTTWSHFVGATRMVESRLAMSMVPPPRARGHAN